MRVFFTEGCPYAHRTRALLTLLAVPFEPRPVDLANKPAELLTLSPTGAVPFLDDEGLVLYESVVINEYLAERFAWSKAFSPDVRQRARERLVMKRWDDVMLPSVLTSVKDPAALEAKPTWRKELDQLGQTLRGSEPESLLGLHLAPHWSRLSVAFPQSVVVRGLRDAVGPFLDGAAALPCVTQTSPNLEEAAKLLRARFAPAPP